MGISVETVSAPQMAAWRDQYRQEMNCQIIHDSLHTREGWTQTYLLRVDQEIAGYGSVAVSGPWKEQPTIFEFYLVPRYRQQMFVIFAALVESTAVGRVETQTNDMLLATLLHATAPSVSSESILFHDQRTSSLVIPDAMVRPAAAADSAAVAAANLDAEARWVLVERDNIVGTGGILFHYNRPYGDIYMQIAEPRAAAGSARLWFKSSSRFATRWEAPRRPAPTRPTLPRAPACKRPGSFPAGASSRALWHRSPSAIGLLVIQAFFAKNWTI